MTIIKEIVTATIILPESHGRSGSTWPLAATFLLLVRTMCSQILRIETSSFTRPPYAPQHVSVVSITQHSSVVSMLIPNSCPDVKTQSATGDDSPKLHHAESSWLRSCTAETFPRSLELHTTL